MKKYILISLLLFSSFYLGGCGSDEQPKEALKAKKQLTPLAATASLPKSIAWQTYEGEYFGDPKAKKGGTYNASIQTYPLTFRLYGPNAASGGFVGYNRRYTMWSLTGLDANTRKTTPQLATHWAVMPDNKTVYYKLDPDAKWSDGTALTADDYLFAFEFMQSKHIQAPFYNQYARDHFASVEKVDQYTIKLVSIKPSWRILYEMSITPLPRHEIVLDENWVKDYNWRVNLTAGPYRLTKMKTGKYLTFERDKNWWGKDKPQFKNLYNFDKIKISIHKLREVQFAMFKKGKLDMFSVNDVSRWVKQTDFDAVQKGYVHKQKIYTESPSGVRGVFFNLKDQILQDRKVRQALAHAFDFKNINKKFLYQMEKRQVNFFDTYPPYKKPNLKAYPFKIKKSNQLLDQAGWTGPRTEEGVRTKNGKPLVVTVSIGTQAWVKYISFYKEIAKQAGINIKVKQLDGAALYTSFDERSYQSLILGYGSGNFPGPRQFLHSENVKKGTNNLFQFANKRVDELIDIYEFNMDEKKRVKAIFEIEDIVKKEVIMLPFWKSDHERLLWWRYLKGPQGFTAKSGVDLDTLWIDLEEKKKLKEFKGAEKGFPLLPIEADPYRLN